MKIYFAGSIRGGREYVETYEVLVEALRRYGEVLTEHVADANLKDDGEAMTDADIFKRDIAWLRSSEVMVAEVTQPSLGVGYEIALAEHLGKRVICLFKEGAGNLSAMIQGNTSLELIRYSSRENALEKLNKALA